MHFSEPDAPPGDEGPLSPDEKVEILKSIAAHEAGIAGLKARLYVHRGNQEFPSSLPVIVWLYFLIWFLATGFWLVRLIIGWEPSIPNEIALAIAGGLVGASTSGWISANQRLANGLEFRDDTQEIDPAVTKERFNERLSFGFFTRPLLGAVVGILIVTGGHFGHFVSTSDRYGIAFLTIVGGLVSKSLLDGVKEGSKKIFGG